jgi:4a-hydroxytetrahydrobiopterin dehydratase
MFIDENCCHTKDSLTTSQISEFLIQTPLWTHDENRNLLTRTYKFGRYSHGPEFAVKVGEMADTQDHHPDLHIYYKKCVVEFTTHSAGGISRNDFICAARTDQLYSRFESA